MCNISFILCIKEVQWSQESRKPESVWVEWVSNTFLFHNLASEFRSFGQVDLTLILFYFGQIITRTKSHVIIWQIVTRIQSHVIFNFSNMYFFSSINERNCGGLSINRPIKVRIVGPVAYSMMHIRPRRPSQVTSQLAKGGGSQYHKGRVLYSSEDAILLGSIRPKTIRTRPCCNRISELCYH